MILRAYVRVSTPAQTSLNVQRERIVQYLPEGTDIRYYEDIISGETLNRPGLKKLMDESNENDMIIISEISRLTRSIEDALRLQKFFREKNVPLFCLGYEGNLFDEENSSKLFEAVVQAQREIELVRMRVRATMTSLKQKKKLRTRPPYGWKFTGKDQDFAEIPEQQSVIKYIFEMYKAGFKYKKIADFLNEHGYNMTLSLNKRKTPSEPPLFYSETIKRILHLDVDTRLKRKNFQITSDSSTDKSQESTTIEETVPKLAIESC